MNRYNSTALLILFLIAALIRADGIAELPLNFHPARQYSSALLARHLYLLGSDNVPNWRLQVSHEAIGDVLEPPVMETLAVAGYHILGQEHLWFPRLLSSLFWLVGGVFVFLIGRWIGGWLPALAATSFYLMLPFAVEASRSFQPNPLMVALTLAAVWTMVQYHVKGARQHFILGCVLSAAAILVMPISVPVLVGSVVGLGVSRRGWQFLTSVHFIVYLLIAVSPAAIYYGYGILSGDMGSKVSTSFIPAYFLNPMYWDGTLKRVRLVMGFSYPIAALLGLLVMDPGPKRSLLFGMWGGHLTVCLVFNYHVSTHDYYHLLLVPIVALSLVPLFRLVADSLLTRSSPAMQPLTYALVALAVFMAAATSFQGRRSFSPDLVDVQTAIRIGSIVEHSTRTVVLDLFSGVSLKYHGEFAGGVWPHHFDIRDAAMWGDAPVDAAERFRNFERRLGQIDYFVITDLPELRNQPDLEHLLDADFRRVHEGEGYLILSPASRADGPHGL
jgi:4-amino-4-deoxy-L-arabinose transferase-like glycosyltransferase